MRFIQVDNSEPQRVTIWLFVPCCMTAHIVEHIPIQSLSPLYGLLFKNCHVLWLVLPSAEERLVLERITLLLLI